jgi:hypothetical protein
MGKIVTLALIAAVLSVAHPDVRDRLKPYAEELLNPVYKWQAKSAISDYSRKLSADVERGRSVPEGDAFGPYIERALPGSALVDPWGSPYFVVKTFRSVQVVSAGPDRIANTSDDIRSEEIRLGR